MKEIKHSGQVWARKMNIPIVDPKGWSSYDDYNHVLITKEEFINRATSSIMAIPKKISRRVANKMLKRI
jgi:hypothetical protein